METMLERDKEISEYELERGKPMPSFSHSLLEKRVMFAFMTYEPQYEIMPELSLELGDMRSVPDIAVCLPRKHDWRNDSLRVSEPPVLTIEILSPKQSLSDVFEKADAYLRHGVPEVWVIIPEIQSISVCTAIGKQKTYTSGDVQHSSNLITLNIEKLFA
jgi:Uma2 family endonuclease